MLLRSVSASANGSTASGGSTLFSGLVINDSYSLTEIYELFQQ